MHVQVVTYRVADVSETEFIDANRGFAEAMADVPGLLAKVWLQGADRSRFGGLYLWRDRQAYEDFLSGELWAEVLADDSMLDVASTDFRVMEALTELTQPGLKLL